MSTPSCSKKAPVLDSYERLYDLGRDVLVGDELPPLGGELGYERAVGRIDLVMSLGL